MENRRTPTGRPATFGGHGCPSARFYRRVYNLPKGRHEGAMSLFIGDDEADDASGEGWERPDRGPSLADMTPELLEAILAFLGPKPGEEMTVCVNRIYYTQKNCGAKFQGGPYAGRFLEEAIADLEAGIIDPLRDEWLVLDVVKRKNRLQSVDIAFIAFNTTAAVFVFVPAYPLHSGVPANDCRYQEEGGAGKAIGGT